MTERERLILKGKEIAPATADEAAIKTAIDTAGQGGGGSDLPPAGADGNVLTADDGEWVSAAPADNEMVITADLDMSDFSIGNFSEESFNRIESAFLARKNVHLIVNVLDEPTLNARLAFRNDDALIFVTETMLDDDDYRYAMWVVTDHEPLVGTACIYNHLPNISGGDNGKILGVDGGAYALVSPSALSNAPLIVHGTISNGDFEFTDTTVKDVYDAKVADRAVFLDDGDGYRWDLTCALYDSNSSTYSIAFGCLKHGETKIVAAIIGISGTADTTTGGSVIESDLTPNV